MVREAFAVHTHFSAGVGTVVLDGLFGDPEGLRDLPAWQHRFDERADAELHRRQHGVTRADLTEVLRVKSVRGKLGLLPRETTLFAVPLRECDPIRSV